jgi:cell division protein FtsL
MEALLQVLCIHGGAIVVLCALYLLFRSTEDLKAKRAIKRLEEKIDKLSELVRDLEVVDEAEEEEPPRWNN